MAGDVPAVHGLGRASRHKIALAFNRPHTFHHPERRAAFRRAPHHPHKVRMHPG
jgi:hypothetical protein